MDAELEERLLQLALDRPDLLCSEVPVEILVACSDDAEPTPFLEEFFGAGFSGWAYQEYGRRLPQPIINNAIIVLWNRACRLHTRVIIGEPDPDWEKPFFSDQDLYDS